MGQNSKFPPFCRDKIQNSPPFIESKFKIHPFLSGQSSKFTPIYWVKIHNSPLFIGSIFCKRSSLRSQTFLSSERYLGNPVYFSKECSLGIKSEMIGLSHGFLGFINPWSLSIVRFPSRWWWCLQKIWECSLYWLFLALLTWRQLDRTSIPLLSSLLLLSCIK